MGCFFVPKLPHNQNKTMRLTLALNDQLFQELDKAHRNTGISATDLARVFIRQGLDAIKSEEGLTVRVQAKAMRPAFPAKPKGFPAANRKSSDRKEAV